MLLRCAIVFRSCWGDAVTLELDAALARVDGRSGVATQTASSCFGCLLPDCCLILCELMRCALIAGARISCSGLGMLGVPPDVASGGEKNGCDIVFLPKGDGDKRWGFAEFTPLCLL